METVENKYKKEKAEPLPNTSGLDDIFNVAVENNQVIDADTGEIMGESKDLDEIKKMRQELADIQKDEPDVDKIILDNIERANRILQKLEDDILGERGTYTASLIEACGRLIDSVTSAANSVTGISYNNEVLRQKERDLDRKDKEVAIKGIVKNADNVSITNNNLTMTREDMLKMIRDSQNES